MKSRRNEERLGIGQPEAGPTIGDAGSADAAVSVTEATVSAAEASAAAATPPPPPIAPTLTTTSGPPPTTPGAAKPAYDGTTNFLKFASPTEWVDLPSRGKYYPENHPFYNCEQIEIKYMTAKEEDILSSRSLLKKGLAIDRMIKSVLTSPVDVNSLLTGDKSAIMIAARITGYGAEYPVSLECPVCSTRTETKWDLSKMEVKEPDEEWLLKHKIEETSVGFKLVLPKTGVTVGVRYMTGHDENRMEQVEKTKKKHNLGESRMTDQFKAMITDINSLDDRALINKFVDSMPAVDSRVLRRTYAEKRPDIDTEMVWTCNDCYSESEVEMPMTAQFFWPE
jgi:hypothetical protein